MNIILKYKKKYRKANWPNWQFQLSREKPFKPIQKKLKNLFAQSFLHYYFQCQIQRIPLRTRASGGTMRHCIITLFLILASTSSTLDSPLTVLGFEKWDSPSPREIKERFKELSKLYHPDKNPNSDTVYKEIVSAYETLKQGDFYIHEISPHMDMEDQPQPKSQSAHYQQEGYKNWRQRAPGMTAEEILRSIDLEMAFQNFINDSGDKNENGSGNDDSNDGNGTRQRRQVVLQFSVNGFVEWGYNNKSLVLAAFLISFGLLNFLQCFKDS